MNYIESVIDTNVLVSALFSKDDSNPTKIINYMFSGKLDPVYSYLIIKEYYDVLKREKFKFNKQDIVDLINYIIHVGHFVVPLESKIKILDESDRKFYDAYKTQSKINKTYLVTGKLKHFPNENNILSPNAMVSLLKNQ